MKESKRFYWIKLKTDFFNQDTIDFLLSQENGCEYIVLYQMLCLNTANNDGKLSSNIGEMIVPYDIKKIVRDTKYFNFDTVTIALELFKQLGLIYEEEDRVLRIKDFDEMVGSETSKAAIMRRKRAKEKELNSGNIVTEMLPECYVEIEKEKEKDIEIRDKDIDKKKDIKKKTYYENDSLNSIFIEFLEVRKKLKAVNSERAINTLLKTLNEYDDDTKYKMIENSIVNSWKSIYPLKEKASNTYKRVEQVPDWFNKKIAENTVTPEEQKVFEEKLKNLGDFETRRAALQERLKNKYRKV